MSNGKFTLKMTHGASSVAIQEDGKIIVVGSKNGDINISKFNKYGEIDYSFGNSGTSITDLAPKPGEMGYSGKNSSDSARSISIQSDGKYLVSGGAIVNWPESEGALIRYNPDGTLDKTFDADGKITNISKGYINSISIQPDGKILAGSGSVKRINPDGSIDVTYKNLFNGIENINDTKIQSDGEIIVAGYRSERYFSYVTYQYEYRYYFSAKRINNDGTDDIIFNGIGDSSKAHAIAIQADGNTIIAGEKNGDIFLGRFNKNGAFDSNFDGDGFAIYDIGNYNERAVDVQIQHDGKILVAAYSQPYPYSNPPPTQKGNIFLIRYLPNGLIDINFGEKGVVNTNLSGSLLKLNIEENGKITTYLNP